MKATNKDFIARLSQSTALIRGVVRATRRHLQLTPMKRVLNELTKRGVSVGDLVALEIFGCSGEGHVKDYASLVSSLEVWEIDPQFENTLRRHFPNATVNITDSYQEIKRTSKKYDLIIVDNGTSTRPGGYCEHFDLFPDIFRIAGDSCILVLNVIPEIDQKDTKGYPYLFNDEQLARRRIFYKTDRPEKVTFAQMLDTYRDLCRTYSFSLDWHFFERRNFIYYLVLRLSKITIVSSNV